ncbi:hypothetical protein Hanom_Chr11g01032161 [Helianthus anomalus]
MAGRSTVTKDTSCCSKAGLQFPNGRIARLVEFWSTYEKVLCNQIGWMPMVNETQCIYRTKKHPFEHVKFKSIIIMVSMIYEALVWFMKRLVTYHDRV